MKNNILKIIDKIKIGAVSEFMILAMVFLVPLYFNYFSPSSVDLSKIVIFRVILFLLLFSSVCSFAFGRIGIYKDRVIYISLPLGLFIFSLLVSLIFSSNFNYSWFGSYDRNEGVISFLLYGLWLILLLFNLNDIFENKAKLRRLLVSILISSSLVSLYALVQLWGFDFFSWSEPAHLTKRAFSSFGQPNYLACWLLLVLPISAYLIYESRNIIVKTAYSFLFTLQLGALFATGSRSSFLSFFLISLSWLTLLLFVKKNLDKKKIIVTIAGFISIILIFITGLWILSPDRLEEFRDIRKGSGSVRLELWEKGFDGFLDRPLFGYGLENQKEAYVRYYEPDWAIYSRPNTYSDRAHNLILDILLTGGLFGLACFIYLIYRIFNSLWISYRDKGRDLSIFLAWSFSSYLLSLLFNFSVTVTNVYFFLFAALAFLASGPVFKKNGQGLKNPLPYFIVIGAFVVMLYGLYSQVMILQGDYYFNKAIKAISEKQYFTALVLNDYLLETRPNEVASLYYGQEISLRLIESLPVISDRSSRYVVSNYLKSFADGIDDASFENRFVKAFALGVTGSRGASEEIFQELSLRSPYMPKIYLAWGDISLISGNPEKAKTKFQKAKSLLPALDNPYLNKDHFEQLQNYYGIIDSRLRAAEQIINR